MEEELHEIRNWANHGTLGQFYNEIIARTGGEGYETEMEGNVVTCYKVHHEGGFLGIGRKTEKEVVLKAIDNEDGTISIPEESADEEFVTLLATRLKQH
ncbi:MAG: hypothetical protein U9R48_10885 [Chloroflexota bacterium]|nr:hypothetical protein [Chloroflexota bacterium]